MEQISENKLWMKYYDLVIKKGVTSYEVSKQTGIALSTLSAWKSNKYTPKMDKIMILAKYFGVPIEYFVN